VTIGVKKEPVASADHDDDDEEGDDEDAENTKEDSDEDNGDTAAELRVNLQKSQKEWGQLHKQYLIKAQEAAICKEKKKKWKKQAQHKGRVCKNLTAAVFKMKAKLKQQKEEAAPCPTPKPWFDEVTQLDSQEGHDADYEYLMDCFQAVHEDGERLCNLNCHLAGEEFEDENGVQRIEPHLWEDLQLPVSHRTVTVVPQAVELLDVDKYMLKIYGHIAERVENVSQKKSKKFCKLLGSDAVNDLDHDEEDFDIYIYIYIYLNDLYNI
jgi:hypothetical protein